MTPDLSAFWGRRKGRGKRGKAEGERRGKGWRKEKEKGSGWRGKEREGWEREALSQTNIYHYTTGDNDVF